MDTLTIDVRGLSDHSLVSQSLMRKWLLSGHARSHWLSPVSSTIKKNGLRKLKRLPFTVFREGLNPGNGNGM